MSGSTPNLKKAHKKFNNERYASIIFDLDLPIEPQTKRAKQVFIELQKHRKSTGGNPKTVFRLHKDNWKVYLQIIDAQYSNEKPSISNFASVIYKGEENEYPEYKASDKVKKNRKAAMALVNGDFKLIAKAGLIEPWGK